MGAEEKQQKGIFSQNTDLANSCTVLHNLHNGGVNAPSTAPQKGLFSYVVGSCRKAPHNSTQKGQKGRAELTDYSRGHRRKRARRRGERGGRAHKGMS